MVHSAVVCDLAVAATYAMFGKPDPIAAAQQVVRGYHAVFPLDEAEVALLYDLICARLVLSVIHAATQQRLAPDNAYLGISEAPAWALLEQSVRDRSGLGALCLAPCLRLGAVSGGCRALHAGWWRMPTSSARSSRLDLTSEPVVVLDLSVASADIESLDDHP